MVLVLDFVCRLLQSDPPAQPLDAPEEKKEQWRRLVEKREEEGREQRSKEKRTDAEKVEKKRKEER